MSDLISRQAAIDAVEHAFDRETILNRFVRKIAISALKVMPSAQPEIIYCVGCKYMHTEETGFWCAQTGKEVRLDHYCGYAERKGRDEGI